MKSLPLLALLLCALILPAGGADEPRAKPAAGAGSVKNVGVEEFDKLRAGKNAVVLDVRTEKEFKGGHIPGAVNLDFNAPDFQTKVAELDKGKTYLVHCAGGVRSAKACDFLRQSGFKNVKNMLGGITAWSDKIDPSVPKY